MSLSRFKHACAIGDIAAAHALLREDYRLVRQADAHGATPLMAAVSGCERSKPLIDAMLAAGANAAAVTREGYNALHISIIGNGRWADRAETRAVYGLLVERGCALEARQHYGWTPLMMAVLEGTEDDVAALLDLGADPDVSFGEASMPGFTKGRTLLEIASSWPEKMALLLAAGADRGLLDGDGRTATQHIERALAKPADPRYPEFREALRASLALLKSAPVAPPMKRVAPPVAEAPPKRKGGRRKK